MTKRDLDSCWDLYSVGDAWRVDSVCLMMGPSFVYGDDDVCGLLHLRPRKTGGGGDDGGVRVRDLRGHRRLGHRRNHQLVDGRNRS